MAAWGRIGRPCNCVRQGMPRKFRARDCTERSRPRQVPRAFPDSPLPPSMPRNLCGAIVTDATPGLLPRGGGRFHRRRRDHPSPTHLPRSPGGKDRRLHHLRRRRACVRCWSCSPARPWATKGDDLCLLAATIEFLHTSTLLHDDVVDASGLRRGRSTANALGQRAERAGRRLPLCPLLRNDGRAGFHAGHAHHIPGHPGDRRGRSAAIVQGTRRQHYRRDLHGSDPRQDRDAFEASTHSAAALCQAGEEQSEALRRFGDYLGIAFQLVDDLLDYRGDAATLGKNVGDDLAEGKPTLPLIVTMRDGTEEQAALVRKAIQQGGSQDLERLCRRRGCRRPGLYRQPRPRLRRPRHRLPGYAAGQRIPLRPGRTQRIRCRPYPLNRARLVTNAAVFTAAFSFATKGTIKTCYYDNKNYSHLTVLSRR